MRTLAEHMADFRGLLNELDAVHSKKIQEYGSARYQGDLDFNLEAAFFDVDRKYIRLRHQIVGARASNHLIDIDKVRETFMDIASYGIMGMQMCDLILDENPPFVGPTDGSGDSE
jgi:hypothetical protein